MRAGTKSLEGVITIVLFIWTVAVFTKIKRALRENELLADLKRQVDAFFAVILTSLTVRAVVAGTVFVLWICNVWQRTVFDYRDSWRFLIWWVYVDATAEGLLNFFLVYHLFKN